MSTAQLTRGVHLFLLIGVHAVCLLAIQTGVDAQTLLLCGVLYVLRMFGVTAGYHRYFAHRTYKTSRPFQFVLALLAISSAQRGVLWWAWHHRHHHRHSDTPDDFHSPMHKGLLYSHVLWWMDEAQRTPDLRKVRDLTPFPELVWLDKYHAVPPIVLAALCYAWAGPAGLVVGFCWSTVLVWHATFTINSLSHIWGRRDHDTDDDSRNNAFLALITMGEGWHNNHHRYPASARQGMGPWQVDLTWMGLRVLERLRIVWDLRSHSPRALADLAHRRGRGRGTAEVTAPSTRH